MKITTLFLISLISTASLSRASDIKEMHDLRGTVVSSGFFFLLIGKAKSTHGNPREKAKPDLKVEEFFEVKPTAIQEDISILLNPKEVGEKQKTVLKTNHELSLQGRNLSKQQVSLLADRLELLPNLEILNLSGCIRFSDPDTQADIIPILCAQIGKLQKLRVLDLSNNALRPFSAVPIACVVNMLGTLQELILTDNILSFSGVNELIRKIGQYRKTNLTIYVGRNLTNGLKLSSLSTEKVTVMDFKITN